MCIKMNKFFVLFYNNEYSVDGSSKKDYEIGKKKHLIGAGKYIGKDKHVFIIFNHNNKDYIGYAGLSGERVQDQPWEEKGGKKWKAVYKSNMHSKPVILNNLCKNVDVDKKIFIESKRIGHVKHQHTTEFEKVLKHFQNLQ